MKKEDIRPENDQVLFEILAVERTTAAGLFLPGAEEENAPVVGRVIAASETASKWTTGMKILLARGVSFPVPLGDHASKERAYLVDKKYILASIN